MSGLVVISDIKPDTDSNSYVRLIQVYDELPGKAGRRPVVELALYGGDQTSSNISPLQITIPGGILF
jgi:hypothetical protein